MEGDYEPGLPEKIIGVVLLVSVGVLFFWLIELIFGG